MIYTILLWYLILECINIFQLKIFEEIMEIDTKTTIILVLLGVIFGMIGSLQGWF